MAPRLVCGFRKTGTYTAQAPGFPVFERYFVQLLWQPTQKRGLVHEQAVNHLQLFRERLSCKRRKAYATMSKVIMGNGSFYSCLIKPWGVSAWWKGTTQKSVFLHSPSLLLNHLEHQSSKENSYYIVAYAFTVLRDNLYPNSFLRYVQKFSRAHWLIFIVNKRADTWNYDLRDASTNESGQYDNLSSKTNWCQF